MSRTPSCNPMSGAGSKMKSAAQGGSAALQLRSIAEFEQSLQEDGVLGRNPQPPPLTSKVSQLDAQFMEDELHEEILQGIARIAQPVAPSFVQKYRPEITLALRALFFRYTVFENKPSLGCQLQGLVYINDSADAAATFAAESALAAARKMVRPVKPVPSPLDEVGIGTLSSVQKWRYAMLGLVMPWMYSRFKEYALRQEWQFEEEGSWRHTTWTLFERVESCWRVCSLLNFIAFLYRGSYRTLVERLLRMRLVHSHTLRPEGATKGPGQRMLDFEMIDQEMVWSTLGRFAIVARHFVPWNFVRRFATVLRAVFVVPLLTAYHLVLTPIISRIPFVGAYMKENGLLPVTSAQETAGASSDGEVSQTFLRHELRKPCRICDGPLVMPYVAGCGHCFCFICLHQACSPLQTFMCPTCQAPIESSQRVKPDMLSS